MTTSQHKRGGVGWSTYELFEKILISSRSVKVWSSEIYGVQAVQAHSSQGQSLKQRGKLGRFDLLQASLQNGVKEERGSSFVRRGATGVLAQRAGNLRKDVVGFAADQLYGSNHDHQNHR